MASAGAVSLVAIAVAGCGSSSSSTATPVDGSAVANAVAPVGGAASSAAPLGRVVRFKPHTGSAPPKIIVGNPIRKPAPGTGGNTINDERRASKVSAADGRAGLANPCALVTREQARAFTHRPVATPTLAPLGPTCVYHELGANAQVTMAVDVAAFSKLKPHIQHLSQFTIAGRTAYCGDYGSSITYVLLSGNRILSILAPCDVGTKFAAAALPKLGY